MAAQRVARVTRRSSVVVLLSPSRIELRQTLGQPLRAWRVCSNRGGAQDESIVEFMIGDTPPFLALGAPPLPPPSPDKREENRSPVQNPSRR